MAAVNEKREKFNAIHTYHCICTSLLLATTYSLPTLSRRAKPPALDKCHILPVPTLPRPLRRVLSSRKENVSGANDDEYEQVSSSSSEDGNKAGYIDQSDGDSDALEDDNQAQTAAPDPRLNPLKSVARAVRCKDEKDFTLLTSLRTAATPILIQRSDGFEKRWTVRCTRCDVIVGYYLDWAQFEQKLQPPQPQLFDQGGTLVDGKKTGRREELLYVLPGAMMSTVEMVEGDERFILEGVSELTAQAT